MSERWINRDAVEWALYEADVADEQRFTLLVVGSFTDAEGRGAYPARVLIARLTGRSVRKAERDLAKLIKQGHLLAGDWRLVLHIRADRRPNVYDLPDKYRVWLGASSLRPVDASRGVRSDRTGRQERPNRASP